MLDRRLDGLFLAQGEGLVSAGRGEKSSETECRGDDAADNRARVDVEDRVVSTEY
jgi:hypothetical protein